MGRYRETKRKGEGWKKCNSRCELIEKKIVLLFFENGKGGGGSLNKEKKI